MAIQIFGSKKCKQSQKAERFLKERSQEYQFIDLNQKAMSARELDSVATAVGSHAALVNEDSKLFQKRGMAWMDYDAREELLQHPDLLKTPIIRSNPKACVGFDENFLSDILES